MGTFEWEEAKEVCEEAICIKLCLLFEVARAGLDTGCLVRAGFEPAATPRPSGASPEAKVLRVLMPLALKPEASLTGPRRRADAGVAFLKIFCAYFWILEPGASFFFVGGGSGVFSYSEFEEVCKLWVVVDEHVSVDGLELVVDFEHVPVGAKVHVPSEDVDEAL